MKKYLAAAMLVLLCFKTYCSGMELSAKSACLIAADSAQVIYADNENDPAPIASTTKIMTALLAAQHGGWEERVRISANAQSQEGTRIYLEAGDSLSLYDMTCAMLLNSGNDAATAIAEHISGSSKKFAEEMTAHAEAIGAENTQFKNPSGLDEPGHYSTAYDLALMARKLLRDDTLAEIAARKQMTVTSENGSVTYLRNHNKLLWNYDGATGVKTGFTKASGRCLVSAAQREGVRLIAVTINAPNDWSDHKKMLDFGFEKCSKKTAVEKGEVLADTMVGGEKLNYLAKDSVLADCVDNKVSGCRVILHRVKNPEAPVNRGEKLGVAEIVQNGNVIGEIDLVADRDIYQGETGGKKHGIKKFLRQLISKK